MRGATWKWTCNERARQSYLLPESVAYVLRLAERVTHCDNPLPVARRGRPELVLDLIYCAIPSVRLWIERKDLCWKVALAGAANVIP